MSATALSRNTQGIHLFFLKYPIAFLDTEDIQNLENNFQITIYDKKLNTITKWKKINNSLNIVNVEIRENMSFAEESDWAMSYNNGGHGPTMIAMENAHKRCYEFWYNN